MATTHPPIEDTVSIARWDTEGGLIEREPDRERVARDRRWREAGTMHWHGSGYTPETQRRADIDRSGSRPAA